MKPFLSTMWAPDDGRWNAYVEILPHRFLGPSDIWAFLVATRRRRAVILLGSISASSLYRDLVLAMVAKWMRRRLRVVVSDATWEARSRTLERRLPWCARFVEKAAHLAIGAVDSPRVVYGVLSSDEVRTFSELWDVPVERVRFTGFSHTLHAQPRDEQIRDDGYLFAGGNSMRDYPLLFEAMTDAGGVAARLATSWEPPAGVDWLRAEMVSHEQFVDWLCGCRASVVPLVQSVRSAGQQTYLNAMLLKKPVVVTDAPGVRDYIEHGVTGIVVPPAAGALSEAIRFVMDPSHGQERRAMGERARAWVLENATPDHYRQRLLQLADQPR